MATTTTKGKTVKLPERYGAVEFDAEDVAEVFDRGDEVVVKFQPKNASAGSFIFTRDEAAAAGLIEKK